MVWMPPAKSPADSERGSRELLPDSQDPRAERTRQAIFLAVSQLMSGRSDAISVNDVVRVAGVSRSSFYKHFANLDEVAIAILEKQFTEIDGGDRPLRLQAASRSAAHAGYTRLVRHMVEALPLYSSLLQLPLTRAAYDEMVDAYATRLLESLRILDSAPADVDPELATHYIAGGALTLISAWMRGRFDVSDDELVDQLVALLPAWLHDDALPEETSNDPS